MSRTFGPQGSRYEKMDRTRQRMAGLQTRDQAKTFIYALIYGAGPAKIGSIVGGGAKEGKIIMDRFMRNMPALQQLRDRVDNASGSGYIRGLDGRLLRVRQQHAAVNLLLQEQVQSSAKNGYGK